MPNILYANTHSDDREQTQGCSGGGRLAERQRMKKKATERIGVRNTWISTKVYTHTYVRTYLV